MRHDKLKTAGAQLSAPLRSETVLGVDSTERARYEELKQTAHNGFDTFYRVGIALREIRDRKLYRLDGHSSFEAFARAEFDLSRPRAYQLIDAATTIEVLRSSAEVSTIVDNEGQARALSGLAPQERIEVVKEAAATAPKGKVTAKHVAQVRKARTARKAGEGEHPAPDKPAESVVPPLHPADRTWRILANARDSLLVARDNLQKLESEDFEALQHTLLSEGVREGICRELESSVEFLRGVIAQLERGAR
jgi:hypothetical protein